MEYKADDLPERNLSDFIVTYVIGQGAFGRVYLAEIENTKDIDKFAIKSIRKDTLVDKNAIP